MRQHLKFSYNEEGEIEPYPIESGDHLYDNMLLLTKGYLGTMIHEVHELIQKTIYANG